MTTITYTDPALVLDAVTTEVPRSGQTVSGYGGKIPTRHLVRYAGTDGRARWHRVYVMVYGNSGSAYIVSGGRTLHLDTDTEHRLSDAV